MDFNPNLSISEILIRYALLIGVGIVAGALHAYWLAPVAIGVFLTAILGWCPLKAFMGKNKVSAS